jgi:hypothetical protein
VGAEAILEIQEFSRGHVRRHDLTIKLNSPGLTTPASATNSPPTCLERRGARTPRVDQRGRVEVSILMIL